MPVFTSPTWKKNETGNAVNLRTCNTLFNSRSMMYNVLRPETIWSDNPAYVPLCSGWSPAHRDLQGETLVDPLNETSGFTRWICPSVFKLSRMHIVLNEISSLTGLTIPFSIWLGEDGPTTDGLHAGETPKKLIKLYNVPLTDDITYTTEMATSEDLNINMASGHSYGYIFEMDETPTLPTTAHLSVSLGSDIWFGGGGAE
jgi:hypothetical protein